MQHKLAALFSADVKEYSRLMGEDETVTFCSEMVTIWQRWIVASPSTLSLPIRVAVRAGGRSG
ncbi:MAG TPA: hypothetical protein VGC99_16605 [Candidatus Tectomicrobia bacterium]